MTNLILGGIGWMSYLNRSWLYCWYYKVIQSTLTSMFEGRESYFSVLINAVHLYIIALFPLRITVFSVDFTRILFSWVQIKTVLMTMWDIQDQYCQRGWKSEMFGLSNSASTFLLGFITLWKQVQTCPCCHWHCKVRLGTLLSLNGKKIGLCVGGSVIYRTLLTELHRAAAWEIAK